MEAILTNPVEIYFGSFTMTSPVPLAATFLASETDPPKAYDLVQGIEHVISTMEDTLEMC
jgi:predicted DNA-binding protein